MKITFVIPFHNEEKNASAMIEAVTEYATTQKWKYEIIPVDDRSTDTTAEVLKKISERYSFVHPLYRPIDNTQTGNTMGKALVEGSKKATGDIIIWTMGDRSDDPNTYGAIVDKINQGFDMVFGSRYMVGGTWGSLDPTKAFLSSRGTMLARVLFGITVHDITNAFRGFRKELINKIPLKSAGFAISPEFALKAHLSGFKLGEVPTVYHDRVEGLSNFKMWNMSLAYLGVFANLFFRKIFAAYG
jgi:glycosyltransferase involved in cell wall biosynthesis